VTPGANLVVERGRRVVERVARSAPAIDPRDVSSPCATAATRTPPRLATFTTSFCDARASTERPSSVGVSPSTKKNDSSRTWPSSPSTGHSMSGNGASRCTTHSPGCETASATAASHSALVTAGPTTTPVPPSNPHRDAVARETERFRRSEHLPTALQPMNLSATALHG
jgi:hypothetical protein